MKIVQFLASKGWGGLENIFVELCNELAKANKVHVIVFEGSFVIAQLSQNVNIHLIKAHHSRYNPRLYIELYQIIKQIKPDIIHTHSAKATQLIYRLESVLKVPWVGTKHNVSKGAIFNKIKYPTAVSLEVANSIKSHSVKVIYNGINPLEDTQNRSYSNGAFRILAVGRLDKIKGFDILINECTKLDFPFNLEIVGDGEERDALRKLIKNTNLEGKVKLVGFQKDIRQRMYDADLVVMSSHSEGFSLVMVEALFYANIFISTKVSGATEIIEEKFLCTHDILAEKINDVYVHKEEYKTVFTRLKDRLQHRFMLDKIADEYIAFYQLVIKKNDEDRID